MIAALQPIVHYALHFLAPAALAWLFFRPQWKKAWLIMLATMLVDIDHIWACQSFLAAEGVTQLFSCPTLFVADRCSIGFHPLHTEVAIAGYLLMLLVPRLRIVATGLLFHMFTDGLDCLWM
ncbi:MAG: DUF6122 family protein [Bacteroidota bacterium]